MSPSRLAVIPGDGIGKEDGPEGLVVLAAVVKFRAMLTPVLECIASL